ncbi:MAG: hypothetical protein AAB289_11115, partial [Chloroflexota bacterium]
MKLNTALGIAAAVLGATFAGQVAVSYFFGKPGPTHFVSWQHYPKSAQEATALAKRIVEARVVNVRRGPDLVLQAPGEPGGADRIPQEVATLQVETDIKGTGPNQIEVSQTAAFIGSPIGRPAPTGPAPPKPVAPDGRTGRDRPAQVPEATYPAAARHLLESAPPYQAGQRYVLFLTDGIPTVGELNEQRIAAKAKDANKVNARVFNFGVGFDVNSRLLDRLSRDHRGQSVYVRPTENIEASVASLYRKIGSPVLTDIAINVDIDAVIP